MDHVHFLLYLYFIPVTLDIIMLHMDYFCLQTKYLWFMNYLYLFSRLDSLTLLPHPLSYFSSSYYFRLCKSTWYYFRLCKSIWYVFLLDLNLQSFWNQMFIYFSKCSAFSRKGVSSELWDHAGNGLWYLRMDFVFIWPFERKLFFLCVFVNLTFDILIWAALGSILITFCT